MKKILFFCFISSLLCLSNVFADSYELPFKPYNIKHTGGIFNSFDNIQNSWGNPRVDVTFIQDAVREPKAFRIEEGWAWEPNGGWPAACSIADRTEASMIAKKDDKAIVVFVARNIYEHGGLFCLTQLAATSSATQFKISHQQPNLPKMPCMVLCEPDWDGTYCQTNLKEAADRTDTPCDTTDIAASIDEITNKKSVYAGNDSITIHWCRTGTADVQDFFHKFKINDFYEHVIYLGATGFMQHGITAQPMLVGAVGTHDLTWLSSGPAGGKTKTLCAQGFTRLSADGKCVMNSKHCGSNAWCSGYSDSNLQKAVHEKEMNGICNVIVCKDKSLALDSEFKCREYDGIQNGRCDVKGNDLYGRFVPCAAKEIFDADKCECVAAQSISKEIMKYGPKGRNTDTVNEQCWTKTSGEDFKACVGIKSE